MENPWGEERKYCRGIPADKAGSKIGYFDVEDVYLLLCSTMSISFIIKVLILLETTK